MNMIAQIFGLIGAISIIISMQMKQKKHILLFLVTGEAAFAIGFILLQAYTGAVVCLISTLQVCVIHHLTVKRKKLPKILIGVFILMSLIGGILSYRKFFDIFPIICAVLYTLTIVQKKSKNIRRVGFFNSLLWIVYDLVVGSYTGVLSDVTYCISIIVGMIRYDIKKK